MKATTSLPLFTSSDFEESLNELEKSTLTKWLNTSPFSDVWTAHDNERKIQPLLRLLQPVETVLKHMGYRSIGTEVPYSCCTLLLNEVHIRQTLVWTWNEAVWLEIVGITKQDYADRHGTYVTEHLQSRINFRPYLIECAYLLGFTNIYYLVTDCKLVLAAQYIFGDSAVRSAVEMVQAEMKRTGRSDYYNVPGLSSCISLALLLNRNSLLKELTLPILERAYAKPLPFKALQHGCIIISRALHTAGILTQALANEAEFSPVLARRPKEPDVTRKKDILPAIWVELIDKWCKLSAERNRKRTIESQRSRIAKAARWALAVHPNTALPHQWTASMAKNFVQAVKKMTVGQWNNPSHKRTTSHADTPLQPAVQAQIINAVRCFFRECKERKLFRVAFDPDEDLRTPSEIIALCGPNPKVIDDDIWEKLEEAGLSLTEQDVLFLVTDIKSSQREASYPFAMVKALAYIWLFAGLRADEIRRLPIGCVGRRSSKKYSHTGENPPDRTIILQVPANKTRGKFKKPVDYRAGEVIESWEHIRPEGPRLLDETSGQFVHFLFEWEGQSISKAYINQTLIPLLCRKAQIDQYDTKGRITCHRARATIATRLYEAGLPIELLQRWLGHRYLATTLYYLNIRLQALNEAYRNAIHVSRHQRSTDYAVEQDTMSTKAEMLESVLVEPETSVDPADDLAYLRPQPKSSNRVLALFAHDSLLKVLKKVPLTMLERQEFSSMRALLLAIATRP